MAWLLQGNEFPPFPEEVRLSVRLCRDLFREWTVKFLPWRSHSTAWHGLISSGKWTILFIPWRSQALADEIFGNFSLSSQPSFIQVVWKLILKTRRRHWIRHKIKKQMFEYICLVFNCLFSSLSYFCLNLRALLLVVRISFLFCTFYFFRFSPGSPGWLAISTCSATSGYV